MNQSVHRLISLVGAFSLVCGQVFASSHSDAPLSKQTAKPLEGLRSIMT